MKRSAPSVAFQDRGYVQQPVSCQFCRSRKLKCDRGRPSCFNCRSRGKDCIYQSDLAATAHAPPPIAGDDAHPLGQNLNLAERVARLEQAVFSHQEPRPSTARGQPASKATRPTQNGSSLPVNHDEEQQKTSQWLEGLLTEDAPGGSPVSVSAKLDLENTVRDFPTFEDASALLDHYIKTVDATYRMLHVPTAWNMLEALYRDLNAGCTPSATQLAFFLGIFAGSVYVCKQAFQLDSASLQGHSQPALAELWAQQAVRLITDPLAPPSVPALQTIVSLAHLCAQMEGVRRIFNILSASGIQMARVMKLHRLDSGLGRDERRKNGANMVDIEVKRRIWWHMVASDWLLSYIGGPHEGTYLLHPQQMETLPPSNVEDTDIPTGKTFLTEESYNLPLSKPTSMTYFLHRIQSATLVRQVVDSLPVSFFSSPGAETCSEVYNKVKALDHKYQNFIQGLPPFFQLTIEDSEAHRTLIMEKPYLEWQRYLINFVLHTQLARLHQPFLIRGSRQPEYEQSRLQCIQSAEIVIEIRNRAMGNHSIGSFTYVLQHFLHAAIILAMEVCFNPDKAQAPRLKNDVIEACRSLEKDLHAKLVPTNMAAGEDVSSGQRMVQSFQNTVRNLRGILRKHVHEDETDNVPTASARDNFASPAQQRRIATRASSSIPQTTNIVPPPSPPPTRPYTGNYNEDTIGGNFPTASEDATELDTAGDLVTDKLWDDFFTVGSSFNDTDWDTFFSDVEANIGGH